MPSLLFALTFLLLVIEEWGRVPPDATRVRPWQGPVLIAASIQGVFVVAITEILSVFHALRQAPLTLAWIAAAGLVFLYGYRRNLLRAGWTRARALLRGVDKADGVLVAVLLILAVLVISVAWVSPPNNVDALQYHMPRVLHWIQQGSLDHFATPYDSQNARPYWAELVILNLRLLWGSDRPANLVQAFGLVGVVIAVSGMTNLLGGSRRTQILAGAVAFAVPMALLEASTPKNDVVSSFWVLSTAYFVILEDRYGMTTRERWALFVSVALTLLTKGTGIPFVVPLLLWYCVASIRRLGLAPFVAQNAPAVLVVVLLNAGFWYRNVETYGGPFGSDLPVGRTVPMETTLMASGEAEDANRFGLAFSSPLAGAGVPGTGSSSFDSPLLSGIEDYLVRWVRMVAMHFVTPVHAVNEAIFRLMRHNPTLFPDAYVESLEFAAWNQEMTAGNPLHVVLIAGALGALLLTRRGRRLDPLVLLAIAASVGLFLVSFAGCIDTVFCMRYELGFFYLAAPVVAVVLYRIAPRAVVFAAAAMLVYAAPYVLFNNMRPVVGLPPWPTRIGSVFTEDVDTILFAQSPEKRDEFEDVAARVLEQDCRTVGLVTSRDDLEYTLWRLLRAPDSGVEIEHLSASRATRKYIDPKRTPCAVICTECDSLPAGLDLPLAKDYGHVRLYLQLPD